MRQEHLRLPVGSNLETSYNKKVFIITEASGAERFFVPKLLSFVCFLENVMHCLSVGDTCIPR